jgi:hypothetical protein
VNPGIFNLTIYQGSTFDLTFIWYANPCCGAYVAGGGRQPVDLTGYTAAMQFRTFPLSPTVEYDASGNLTLGGPLGTIALSIPATATEGFTWWAGVYDLLLTDPSGNVTPLLSGTVTIIPSVTIPPQGQAITTDSGIPITTDSGTQINTSTN